MDKKTVKFVKSKLGNIEVKHLDDREIKDFIIHLEIYLNNLESFSPYIEEENILKANHIYVFIRHRDLKENVINEFENYIQSIFPKANVLLKAQKEETKLIIDLFLYK